MRAYVLLKVRPKDTPRLMQDLKNEAHIITANVIHGPYDCLLEVDGKTMDEINDTVIAVRDMPGVLESLTCMVMHSWSRGAP